MKRLIISFLFVFSTAFVAFSQQNPSRGPMSISLLSASGGIYMPFSDMSDRFGPFGGIGLDFGRKTKKNWMYGIQGQYYFGNEVDQPDMFQYLSSGSGLVLSEAGIDADLILRLRGFSGFLYAGRIIPIFKKQANSGILLKLGVGYMTHNIYIQNKGFYTPQLEGDYLKGYDRLTGGVALNQFIGYQHIGRTRLINYFLGLDITQAFTKSLRGYSYDRMGPENENRFDFFIGFRGGWILPFYKRADQDFMTF